MNKNLMSLALCGLMASSAASAINLGSFRNGLRSAGSATANNAAPLGLIALAIANYNAKNKIKTLPGAKTDGILSLGEPAVALVLAFGLHNAMRGDVPMKKNWSNLTKIASSKDPLETLFVDGGKLFGTAGALYSVGKYAYKSFKPAPAA